MKSSTMPNPSGSPATDKQCSAALSNAFHATASAPSVSMASPTISGPSSSSAGNKIPPPALPSPRSLPSSSHTTAPAAAKFPSVNRVASHFTTLSVNNQPPSQSSRPAELKFDGIESATRLPASIISRAKQGDPDACLDAAKMVSEGLPARHQDWKLAAQLFKAAADRGSLEASFQLAWLAFLGEGMAKNDRSAFDHWQEVSTKSDDKVLKPIATHMVGWMHYLGRGTQQDIQKGTKIIRDNKSDEFKLGEDECLAARWNAIKSDSPASCKFFELCQLGSEQEWLCRHLMAVCVFHGFGTIEDEKQAAGTFEQLANEGHSDSQLWIGECYYDDWGVSRDWRKAFGWFSKSAGKGNSYGQWRVGRGYHRGYGVTKDHTKAVEWLRKSAGQGNRYGQDILGFCYHDGYGVPKNIDTAIFWYRKSADQGCDWAIDSLKKLDQWP
ncbi:uncharacterized protein BJ171DRAFT_461325 [Polychytrium aggregatum]|uniref:uncharacterized protein n=1 Tax=Polychytrium aggregatum TaxID=110093 RepID=UPI0022FE265A|nr:uncharacterized protein BJ171DRAFT_461325 [Polychytrium aggregatum]KAI9202403.1 hypothetical protein BJ171DRAFT_461325 [Polychytrium aggregatum]